MDKDDLLVAQGAVNRYALSGTASEEELPGLSRTSERLGRALARSGVVVRARDHRLPGGGMIRLSWAEPGARMDLRA